MRILGDQTLTHQFKLSGNAECFVPFTDLSDPNFSNKAMLTKEFVFGQADGHVVCYLLSQKSETRLWSIYPKGSKAGVVCLSIFNFTKNGTLDVIVGRNDTTIEVFINMAPKNSGTPIFELRGSVKIEESITNIESAYFGPLGRPESIVTTYSGKIYGVFDDEVGSMIDLGDIKQHKKKQEFEMKDLKSQIEKLELKVDQVNSNQIQTGNVRDPNSNLKGIFSAGVEPLRVENG